MAVCSRVGTPTGKAPPGPSGSSAWTVGWLVDPWLNLRLWAGSKGDRGAGSECANVSGGEEDFNVSTTCWCGEVVESHHSQHFMCRSSVLKHGQIQRSNHSQITLLMCFMTSPQDKPIEASCRWALDCLGSSPLDHVEAGNHGWKERCPSNI